VAFWPKVPLHSKKDVQNSRGNFLFDFLIATRETVAKPVFNSISQRRFCRKTTPSPQSDSISWRIFRIGFASRQRLSHSDHARRPKSSCSLIIIVEPGPDLQSAEIPLNSISGELFSGGQGTGVAYSAFYHCGDTSCSILLMPDRSVRISQLSHGNSQVRGLHRKMFFPMIDSDSVFSLTISFSEPCLGIQACFPHDCHHRTYIHHPQMMRLTLPLHLDRTESPGPVHNTCITGIVPSMQSAEQLALQLGFCQRVCKLANWDLKD
jgi:hypothetical protein